MLKKFLCLLLLFVFFISALVEAKVSVKWYYRKDGTYVKSHYRSNPDGIKSNNYSSTDNPNTSSDLIRISGYYKKDGTYVSWHRRTKANETITDNRSYEWNNDYYNSEDNRSAKEKFASTISKDTSSLQEKEYLSKKKWVEEKQKIQKEYMNNYINDMKSSGKEFYDVSFKSYISFTTDDVTTATATCYLNSDLETETYTEDVKDCMSKKLKHYSDLLSLDYCNNYIDWEIKNWSCQCKIWDTYDSAIWKCISNSEKSSCPENSTLKNSLCYCNNWYELSSDQSSCIKPTYCEEDIKIVKWKEKYNGKKVFKSKKNWKKYFFKKWTSKWYFSDCYK